jgi:hypothetical protein
MRQDYETQDLRVDTAPAAAPVAFVWRCRRCGRYIGTFYSLDGSLEVRHRCGATNRISGCLAPLHVVDEADERV